MANNYLQFSTGLTNITVGEKKWVKSMNDALTDFTSRGLSLDKSKDLRSFSKKYGKESLDLIQALELDGYLEFEFSVYLADSTLWIRTEESGSPTQAIGVFQVIF